MISVEPALLQLTGIDSLPLVLGNTNHRGSKKRSLLMKRQCMKNVIYTGHGGTGWCHSARTFPSKPTNSVRPENTPTPDRMDSVPKAASLDVVESV